MGTSDIFKPSGQKTVGHFETCKKPNNDGVLDTWTVAKGEEGQNGTDEPPDDRTCSQCHGPTDGKEQLCSVGDGLIWLHPECQRPYLQRVYQ